MTTTHLQWLAIQTAGAELVGVLHQPSGRLRSDVGVLIIVGGPQYRVGAHRHFVLLARALSRAGYPTLRFDHRGVGDSVGPLPRFEAIDDDIAAAIDALVNAHPGLRGVVLWGLCDGASAALLYAERRRDGRVCGLALLNPWVRSVHGQARAQVRHYYIDRLRSPDFWRKTLGGGVGLGALQGWWRAWRQSRAKHPVAGKAAQIDMPFQVVMARAWQRFQGPVLLQLSGQDHTAREFEAVADSFPAWNGWQLRPQTVLQAFAQADHTFSASAQQEAGTRGLLDWLAQHWPAR
ncbi:MAG: hydrolase 1, exosortase A system-associated [Aquabacterium sp.]|nr:hydrolase 1, exosortase A system-associated [Aquabacterium sp.]